MGNRAAEVDKSQPKIEPAWLLISTNDIKLLDSYHAVTLASYGVWSGLRSLSGHIFTQELAKKYGIVHLWIRLEEKLDVSEGDLGITEIE